MISRREMVTAGVLGSLSTSAFAEADQGRGSANDDQEIKAGFRSLKDELSDIKAVLDDGLKKSSLDHDAYIGLLRKGFTTFLRANGKFPEFCEIGGDVFYLVYDWHVKHMQPITIVRLAENRMAIQFMFTQLVLRWEQQPNFIGIPFDR